MSARLKANKFNNLARMELFLWDLEIFMQIQSLLKSKIVLKGGAAVQFYLPIEYQRSSIDIDIICSVSKKEIEIILKRIESKFSGEGELFKFRLHKPRNPKTNLPLYTYYMTVPSICSDRELFRTQSNIQEVKIEFFTSNKYYKINRISSPSLFAIKSSNKYNILNLNQLFADKLTTIGPNTIGIQKRRYDELIKQLYDIDMLFKFNFRNLNFYEIKRSFITRAKLECKYRKIRFSLNIIKSDILDFLKQIANIDFNNNADFIKLINDFQSLYLKRSINRNIPQWAVVGSKLYLIIDCLMSRKYDFSKLKYIFQIEDYLEFNHLKGYKKGEYIKKFKSEFLLRFKKYCKNPFSKIQGKSVLRLIWVILSKDNIEDIYLWIKNYIKKNN